MDLISETECTYSTLMSGPASACRRECLSQTTLRRAASVAMFEEEENDIPIAAITDYAFVLALKWPCIK